jgi:hypothetical protein
VIPGGHEYKIQGKARAMVVVKSRKHCVEFYHEMKSQMAEMGQPILVSWI